MQVLDEEKRQRILGAAAEQFASRAFHKVLLSDVASAAAVGKGTLYQYFDSKEDLFVSLLLVGFGDLVEQMRGVAAKHDTPISRMRQIVHVFFSHWIHNPHMFELMRQVSYQMVDRPEWQEKRAEITGLIAATIEEGIAAGVFRDGNPQITSQMIPGMIRSLLLKTQGQFSVEEMERHVTDFVMRGLTIDGANL